MSGVTDLILPCLAAVDASAIVGWCLHGLNGVAVTYVGFKLQQGAAERAQTRAEAKKAAEDVANARFETLRTELLGGLQLLSQALAEKERRLDDGDVLFEKLQERDQHNELKLEQRFGEMTKFVLQSCATREDLQGLRLQVATMERKLGEAIEQVNHKVGGGRSRT